MEERCGPPPRIAGGKKPPEIEALELAHHAIDQGAAGTPSTSTKP
jgi:DhnA family fructose-bisphosphate aldolase class Ia